MTGAGVYSDVRLERDLRTSGLYWINAIRPDSSIEAIGSFSMLDDHDGLELRAAITLAVKARLVCSGAPDCSADGHHIEGCFSAVTERRIAALREMGRSDGAG